MIMKINVEGKTRKGKLKRKKLNENDVKMILKVDQVEV